MKLNLAFQSLGVMSLLWLFDASGMTPDELKTKLDAGEHVTVIDVRSNDLFAQGHIPGAINIPAALVAQKRLPALGRVVVCDDGLGRDLATAATTALNQKPGIKAEALNGGFAAWEMVPGVMTTRGRGAEREVLPMLTYHELKIAQSNDVVLVDLRTAPGDASGPATKSLSAPGTNALTDLQAAFPGALITRSPFHLPVARKSLSDSGAPPPPPLLVLVDNGDGSAEKTARTLRANGFTRVVILAGGEQILSRQGQSGLQRMGSSTTVNGPAPGGRTN